MNKNKVLQPSFLEPSFARKWNFSETADKEYDFIDFKTITLITLLGLLGKT